MIRYINAHPTYICSVAYEGWLQARKACGFDPGVRTITLYAGKTIRRYPSMGTRRGKT